MSRKNSYGVEWNEKFLRDYIPRIMHECANLMDNYYYADVVGAYKDKKTGKVLRYGAGLVKRGPKKLYKKDGSPTKAFQKYLATPKAGKPFYFWKDNGHGSNGNAPVPKYFIVYLKKDLREDDLKDPGNRFTFEKNPRTSEPNWFAKMEKGGMSNLPQQDPGFKAWQWMKVQAQTSSAQRRP